MKRITKRRIAWLAGLLLCAGDASAVDGVSEINQTCALNTGCFAGDTAGFPVTITASGSYRLTSNLDITQETDPADTTVVSVTADEVTLDLNGFAIHGSVTCSGVPATCSDSGSGIGVFVNSSARGFALHGGSISGMGSDGVQAGGLDIIIEDLRVSNIAGDCIQAGFDSIVRGNSMRQCAGNGIVVSFGSLVHGNAVRQCAGYGISMDSATSGFAGNVLGANNSGGDQTFGGTDLGGNLCNVSTTCP